jgi:hypothetical protein
MGRVFRTRLSSRALASAYATATTRSNAVGIACALKMLSHASRKIIPAIPTAIDASPVRTGTGSIASHEVWEEHSDPDRVAPCLSIDRESRLRQRPSWIDVTRRRIELNLKLRAQLTEALLDTHRLEP